MKRYFAYSQDLGFELFYTFDEARKAAQSEIDNYRDCCDPEWPDDVEFVYFGEVFAQSKAVPCEEVENCCDYVLESLPTKDAANG